MCCSPGVGFLRLTRYVTMVHGVQDSTATGKAVMPGAYDRRPDAVNVPVMDNRGALSSPGGWRAANLARMAIRFLQHSNESFHCFHQKRHFEIFPKFLASMICPRNPASARRHSAARSSERVLDRARRGEQQQREARRRHQSGRRQQGSARASTSRRGSKKKRGHRERNE